MIEASLGNNRDLAWEILTAKICQLGFLRLFCEIYQSKIYFDNLSGIYDLSFMNGYVVLVAGKLKPLPPTAQKLKLQPNEGKFVGIWEDREDNQIRIQKVMWGGERGSTLVVDMHTPLDGPLKAALYPVCDNL